MFTMKKTALATAMGLVCGLAAANANAITVTFANNATPSASTPYVLPSSGCTSAYTTAFAAGKEFRMIGPFGAGCTVGGGGEKSVTSTAAGQAWVFNGDAVTGGTLTGTTGFPGNSGTPTVSGGPGFPGSAAPTPGTNPTMGQSASFFGPLFNFLAPTTTSLAGTAYGAMTLSFNSTDNFTMHAPVMEAQWGGTWFPLGQTGGVGVTFNCSGALSGTFTCFGEHVITGAEDPGAAGFAGWAAQWELHGTLSTAHVAAVPVPAAVWLFGSGLLGLVGIARRKKTA